MTCPVQGNRGGMTPARRRGCSQCWTRLPPMDTANGTDDCSPLPWGTCRSIKFGGSCEPRRSSCNAREAGASARIRSSGRRPPTWSRSTSIHRRTRWCSASMRNPRLPGRHACRGKRSVGRDTPRDLCPWASVLGFDDSTTAERRNVATIDNLRLTTDASVPPSPIGNAPRCRTGSSRRALAAGTRRPVPRLP